MSIYKYNSEGYHDPTVFEALTNIEREVRKTPLKPIVFICSPASNVAVTFSSPLPGVPRIVLTANSTTSGVLCAKTKNVTASGFDSILGGSGLSGIVFDYVAIYRS